MSLLPGPTSRILSVCFGKLSVSYTTVRLVSRTSAINRGLRSSSRPERNTSRAPSRGPPTGASRIRKHTTHDDEPFNDDAPRQRVRPRTATRGDGEQSERLRPSGFGGARRDTGGSARGGDREDRPRPLAFGRPRREQDSAAPPPRTSFGKTFRAGTNAFGKDARTRGSKMSTPERPHYKDVQQSIRRRPSEDEDEDFDSPVPPSRARSPWIESTARPPRIAGKFTGQCHKCGGTGHRAAECDGSGEGEVEEADAPRQRRERDDYRPARPVERRDDDRAPRRAERPQDARTARREDREDDRPARRETRDDTRPSRRDVREDTRPSKSAPRGSDELDDTDIPVSIPYTTASSQFLYGYNAVLAALRAKRRKLYQLHLRDSRHIGDADQDPSADPALLASLARRADIKVSHSASARMLDKISQNRPHNGVVLEASALPALPVLSLGLPSPSTSEIPLELSHQSREEEAINGAASTLPFTSTSITNQQPFILFLDGITDPGNIGAILRSAHFFGVTAVAVATNTCAPLTSPVLAKASSGACEAVPLFAISKPAAFILESKKAGWGIYAAVAPSPSKGGRAKQVSSTTLSNASPLAEKPCILMLGGEGEGLRENLRNKADVEITIERRTPAGAVDVGVDSVNVSVAAGLLAEAFTRARAIAISRKEEITDDTDVEVLEEPRQEVLGF
ncbi:hypothetical protein LTR95_003411 [Oleoguttula sp. CCFEE 5521]